MKKLVIVLKILAFSIGAVFIVIPLAAWLGLWIRGEAINIHWSFWMGLGLFSILFITASIIHNKMETKYESQTY